MAHYGILRAMQQIKASVDDDLARWIESASKQAGLSVSSFVRLMLRDALDRFLEKRGAGKPQARKR